MSIETTRRHARRLPVPTALPARATSPPPPSRLPRALPDCPPHLLLPAHPQPRPILLAAAPPPALPLPAWAACLFYRQVEEGGPSAEGWPPFPQKPRPDAGFGPEAGRR